MHNYQMNTKQSYVGGGNNDPNSSQTVNSDQQSLISADEWCGTDLFEHLSDALTRHDARQMVRAWFLSYLLQGEVTLIANPGDASQNAYMYSEFDSFLTSPQMPTSADEWFGTGLGAELRSHSGRQNGRLMLRSWFLAYALLTEFDAPLNPCQLRVNVYLYESLDSFLSAPVVAGKEADND